MDDLNLIVIDSLSATETVEINLTSLFLDVNEPIIVIDYGDIWSFITVSESIDTLELVVVFEPEVALSVYEIITVTESFSRPFEIGLFEQFFLTEWASIANGILFLSVYETDIVITDIALAVVVQNVFVYDVTSPIEYVELKLGRWIAPIDYVVISEFINIARDILYNIISEPISVIEYAILGREVEMLDTYTDITVNELVVLEPIIDLAFNDFLRSYPFNEETVTNVLVELFENGAEQRRDKWGRTKKRFEVTFSPRSKTEIDALRAFYSSHRGPAVAFDFISPLDNIDYIVRFEDNSLKISRVAFGIYSASVRLIEVFR